MDIRIGLLLRARGIRCLVINCCRNNDEKSKPSLAKPTAFILRAPNTREGAVIGSASGLRSARCFAADLERVVQVAICLPVKHQQYMSITSGSQSVATYIDFAHLDGPLAFFRDGNGRNLN